VLPSRGLIGLFGLLLTALLASIPAAADQDHLRLLVFGADARPIQPAKSQGVDDSAVALSSRAGRSMTGASSAGRSTPRCRRRFVTRWRPITLGSRAPSLMSHPGTGYRRWHPASQRHRNKTRAYHGRGQSLVRRRAGTSRYRLRSTEEPLVYDLAITTKDRLPLEVMLAADNTGTPETGLYRTGMGVDWSNAFWRGDDLSYGFLAGPDGFRLLQHAVSYTTYLPWRDTMTLSAVTADTRGNAIGSSTALGQRARRHRFLALQCFAALGSGF
jgi:hypothetical protein